MTHQSPLYVVYAQIFTAHGTLCHLIDHGISLHDVLLVLSEWLPPRSVNVLIVAPDPGAPDTLHPNSAVLRMDFIISQI